MTGRVSAMKEAAGTRLTSTYFGGNSANLGAVGGGETSSLVTANLPPYTPAGSVSVNSSANNIVTNTGGFTNIGAGSISSFGCFATPFAQAAGTQTSTGSLAGTAQGGTSAPVRTVMPTIIVNKILRIL
jgi:hypothetical protein